ncbi:hypothetical protein FB001_1212 [Ensifer sp. SEMIA 135]|nr:hypothetical protein FB000_124129 [Ensifer sp. SEMIA 134]TWB30026.1 hypothetical protein FB001_1212 [Ensifer sp. SEMIA 135]
MAHRTEFLTVPTKPSAVHEDAREHAHQVAHTPKFDGSRNERKNVAILFAHLKTTLRFEQITRPERNQ